MLASTQILPAPGFDRGLQAFELKLGPSPSGTEKQPIMVLAGSSCDGALLPQTQQAVAGAGAAAWASGNASAPPPACARGTPIGYAASRPAVTTTGADGSGAALVWIVNPPGTTGILGYPGQSTLDAFDALPDEDGLLALRSSTPIGNAAKFVQPTIDGSVLYVPTRDGSVLAVGFGPPPPPTPP